MLRKTFLAAAMAALAFSAHAATTTVGYSAAAQESNFGAPSNVSDGAAYEVITSQTSTGLSVDVRLTGDHASNALDFSNIYLGGNTSVGFEVNNMRAFIPGGNGTYFALAGTGFSEHESGSAATGDLDIGFTLPFSFLENDPLHMGFTKLSAAPGDNFTRVSLSQSFGYSVAGGQALYGDNRLGAFSIPVPEPSSMALMAFGLAGLGLMARRKSQG